MGDRVKVQTQDLVILGLLMDGPKHGYELKQTIDSTLSEIAQITSGTVYYTLRRLEKAGWVDSRRERHGNRPERTVYHITPGGRDEFGKLLRAALFADERPWFAFDAGLYFSPHAGLDVLEEAIDAKLRQTDTYRDKLRQVEIAFPGRWPFHLFYIREHARTVLDGTEDWLRRLKNKVARKRRTVAAAVPARR
ncbi:MAG: PadR family transcriptional regulator [Planctomycetes bacterium]|nr:PadR family transcriptional regulator [Planctomycetota bacterium]